MHDRKIALKVSATERGIFQEAYRLSRLPVFDLQLLLAPVMPIFELRVNELEKMWKARRVKLSFENLRIFRSRVKKLEEMWKARRVKLPLMTPIFELRLKEFELAWKGGRGDTDPEPAIASQRKQKIKPQDQLSSTEKARQKKIEETELRRKRRIEKRVALYGRNSIEKPWYDFGQRAISSYRCNQFVKLRVIPPAEGEKEEKRKRNRTTRDIYIGVHTINVSLQDKELSVLVLLDSETMLISLRTLGWKNSIENEIRFFRATLAGLKLQRDDIRFVNPGNPARVGSKPLAEAKVNLKDQEKDWVIKFDSPYVFQEANTSLCFDMSAKKFKAQLAKILIAYNIGVARKRTGPFLALRRRISNRKNYRKDEDLVRQIKVLLKITTG
jgi:hypothetical protein